MPSRLVKKRLANPRALLACLIFATGATVPAAAQARTTLEAVRAQGFVRCAGVERPGLAAPDGNSGWTGLEVDICRAVALAVLGPSARVAYHAYESDRSFDGARDGSDQIAFLSAAEIDDQHLADRLQPGPTVFVESHDLMVAWDSPAKHATDLAGTSVCFIIATPPHDSLDGWFGARRLPLVRFPFREEDEMYDAYAVQRCAAIVGESTALAQARLNGGINRLRSRLLPEHLATIPIVAATPRETDPQWAGIVSSTIVALREAESRATYPHPIAQVGFTVAGDRLGLASEWRKTVLARVGDYGTIFDRDLGAGSPLKLEIGLNAQDGRVPAPR